MKIELNEGTIVFLNTKFAIQNQGYRLVYVLVCLLKEVVEGREMQIFIDLE